VSAPEAIMLREQLRLRTEMFEQLGEATAETFRQLERFLDEAVVELEVLRDDPRKVLPLDKTVTVGAIIAKAVECLEQAKGLLA
jgi:hypothetical protein